MDSVTWIFGPVYPCLFVLLLKNMEIVLARAHNYVPLILIFSQHLEGRHCQLLCVL